MSCVGLRSEFRLIIKVNVLFIYLFRCIFFCILLYGLGSLEIRMKDFIFLKKVFLFYFFVIKYVCIYVYYICVELLEYLRCEVRSKFKWDVNILLLNRRLRIYEMIIRV